MHFGDDERTVARAASNFTRQGRILFTTFQEVIGILSKKRFDSVEPLFSGPFLLISDRDIA
jgi:hypothetical protein